MTDEIKKPTTAQQVKEMFTELIRDQINGDKGHGWGVDDSLAVIEGMVDYARTLDCPFGEIRSYVKWAINPSAARQSLEAQGALNPSAKKVGGVLAGLDL